MILALELLSDGARGHARDDAGAVQTARSSVSWRAYARATLARTHRYSARFGRGLGARNRAIRAHRAGFSGELDWALAASNFAAQSLARDYVSRLAQGLASSIAALSPRRVCIGGALGRTIFSQIHDELASELRDYGVARAWNGDLVLSAPGSSHVESIAPGTLAVATLGAPPIERIKAE